MESTDLVFKQSESRAAWRPIGSRRVWRFADFGLVAVVWALVVWQLVAYVFRAPASRWSDDVLQALLYGLPLVAAIWMPIRIVWGFAPDARVEWRMQLAVTRIEPGDYLWNRIRRPLLVSLTGFPLGHLTLLLLTVCTDRDPWDEKLPILLILMSVAGAMYGISTAGVMDQLRRFCRANSERHAVPVAASWVIVSVVIPASLLLSILVGIKGANAPFWVTGVVAVLTQLGVIHMALIQAKRNWRAACWEYFNFEEPTHLAWNLRPNSPL